MIVDDTDVLVPRSQEPIYKLTQIADLIEILNEYGRSKKILAGGQTLRRVLPQHANDLQ
jgi:CO/xanthine dehydrogenase FAD-binding subunit